MAVNSESTLIASGSNDKSVIIWDVTGKLTIDSNIVDVKSALFNMAFTRTDIPLEFICPITHELMRNPVLTEGKYRYFHIYFLFVKIPSRNTLIPIYRSAAQYPKTFNALIKKIIQIFVYLPTPFNRPLRVFKLFLFLSVYNIYLWKFL